MRKSDRKTTALAASPGRPRGFDSEKALDDAMEVFWKNGYKAASMEDLLNATGLSRSSFYDTFDSKRDLLLTAVHHYCDTNHDKLVGIVDDAEAPREAIRDILTLMANGGGTKGCLLVNCITELAPHDEDVRTIARDHGKRLEKLLVKLMLREQGGRTSKATRTRAQALITLAYGATLMRKSGMDDAQIRSLLKTGEAMLD